MTLNLFIHDNRVSFADHAEADVLTVATPEGCSLETAAGRAWLFVPRDDRVRTAMDAWDVYEACLATEDTGFTLEGRQTARERALVERIGTMRRDGATLREVSRAVGLSHSKVWAREKQAR